MKTNEHKVFGSSDNLLGTIWWDGEEVKSSSQAMQDHFEKEYYLDPKGGEDEITELAKKFKSGYFRFKKVV